MIIFDETFKDLVSAPIKRTDVIVAKQLPDTYGYYDDTPIWTSSDLLMSVQIDSVGFFLGTVTKKAVVKLLGIVDTAAVNDIFQIRLGAFDEDPSVSGFNYISEGFFFVDSVVYDYEAGSTTVTMYDHMWKAQQTKYIDALDTFSFIYPATVEGLAGQIALFLGLNLMLGFPSLPNYDFSILSDPYLLISNSTIQTMIAEIAGITGTTARISDNTLVFSSFNVSSENLTSDNLKTLKVGDKYGPVTSVILGRVPQNDNIVIANTAPVANVLSDIDINSNMLTVGGHGMVDGSLVRLTSYGTYPEPLLADTNYYVYTDGATDTFFLTPTYADAIAGTNIIDITSAGSGAMTLSNLATQEIQINNNQLLDSDRTTLLPELYAALIGLEWSEVKSDTTGLGYYEVGDVIGFTQGGTTYRAFISEIHLTLEGSIKENIVSTIPNADTINYQTAGGILKTIYNTEIEVDKQNQTITSVISQVDQIGNEVAENYSEITQTISDITNSFQTTGGSNLIKNSVGYDVDDDGVPISWILTGTGAVSSESSAESTNYGGLSGNKIVISGASPILTQNVLVKPNSQYSISLLLKKPSMAGTFTLRLSNDVDDFSVVIPAGETYLWEQVSIIGFEPTMGYLNVALECVDSEVEITDIILVASAIKGIWQQAIGEVSNSVITLNAMGIKVRQHGGDYTQITADEFAGYSSASGSSKKIFWLDREETHSVKFEAVEQIAMPPIKIVPVLTGSTTGWAFVKAGE